LSLAAIFSLLASLVVIGAQAATPSSGTLSTTNPSLSYSAGPFVVANVSGTAGEIICDATLPCDEFALTVSVPAGYEANNNMTVKVEWPNKVADFDLYVLDANGAEIKAAASTNDPEVVVIPAATGNYTVRVVPYAPLAESFNASVSIAPKAGSGSIPSTETAAGYQNYAAPSTLRRAADAGEPSIGVNWKTGKVFFQSYTQTYRITFNDATSPATAAWEDKSAPTALTSLDPILFTDRQTGRTFESQLAGKASIMAFTDNDGESWTPSQGSGINSGVDHQTVGGGPFAPGLVGPLTSYPNAVYYCSQDIADAMCALSRDGGLTFGPAVPIYSLLDCGGLHGHVKVAPDGTVYVPNKGCGGEQAVVVSTDNGATWTVRKVPGSIAGDSDPSLGIATDGTIYFGYQNGDGHPRVAVSRDRGVTWINDQDVGTAFGIQNTAFPVTVAGDGDRAAMAFLGTPTGGNYEDTANFQGVWHLYVAHTYDGGKSWVTTDATPNDPVQRGSICLGGTTCGNDRNLLDFNDATIDKEGRVLVAYADGCTGACAQSGPNSFSSYATIARQSTGKRLFAAFDQADLTPTNLAAFYTKPKTTVLTATVANIGTATARDVVVRFLDGSTVVGQSAPITVPAGGTVDATYAWDTSRLKGTRVITAVVDPANTVGEANETNNRIERSLPLR
jgi:hypothetical protein